jgi:hypothetical protein
MQINKETTTETSQPVKLPFYLLDSANAIKCTIDATKVIEALQRLYDTSFDLNIYKDSIGNIMFHLHEHEKKKMPIDTLYLLEDIGNLFSLYKFLQEITGRNVIAIDSIVNAKINTDVQ